VHLLAKVHLTVEVADYLGEVEVEIHQGAEDYLGEVVVVPVSCLYLGDSNLFLVEVAGQFLQLL
jgi:hypothetical protein